MKRRAFLTRLAGVTAGAAGLLAFRRTLTPDEPEPPFVMERVDPATFSWTEYGPGINYIELDDSSEEWAAALHEGNLSYEEARARLATIEGAMERRKAERESL